MGDSAQLARDAQSLVSATILGEDAQALWMDLAKDQGNPAAWSCGIAVLLAALAAGMLRSAAAGDRQAALALWQASLAASGVDSATEAAKRLRGETDA